MALKEIELINIFIRIESGLTEVNFNIFRDLFKKYKPDFYDLVPPSSFTVHYKRNQKNSISAQQLLEELQNCEIETEFLIGYSEGSAYCEMNLTGKILSAPSGKSVADATHMFIAEVKADSFRLLNRSSDISVK
ncbi:MAG: hypothetical protein JW982_05575 [Spirochaetes bacterium]|nr:hypothetical protein [Spirochaetota bacterium]